MTTQLLTYFSFFKKNDFSFLKQIYKISHFLNTKNGLLFLLITLPILNSTAQLPEHSKLADYFTELNERTLKAVTTAGTGLKADMIGASAAVSIAIGNTQVSMADEADEEIRDLNEQEKVTLTELQLLVKQLERSSNLKRMTGIATTFSQQLAIDKTAPSIESIAPHFLIPSGREVKLIIKGQFAEEPSDNPFEQPKINFHEEQTLKNAANKTTHSSKTVTILPLEQSPTQLTFTIPQEYLPIHTGGLGQAVMQLEIPYKSKRFLKSKTETAVYQLIAGLVPPSPGKITLSYRTTRQTDNTTDKQTKTYIQHATNGDLSENYCLPNITEGELVAGSQRLVVEWSEGEKDTDWSYYKQGKCFVVETFYDPEGTSGKLNFHLAYQVSSQSQQSKSGNEKATLNWGDERSFTLPTMLGWTLTFESYTGNVSTYTQATQNSLLDIEVVGRQLIVRTPSVEGFVK